MLSSPTRTLFTEQVDHSRQPVSLAASALIHLGVIALVSFGILYAPRVEVHPNENLLIRDLDLRNADQLMRRAANGIQYPGPRSAAQAGRAGRAASQARSLTVITHAPRGPQTLLQPDLAARLAAHERVPVPQVLIWSAHNTIVKTIVAPLPKPPAAAEVKPTFHPPNHEINLHDVEIASSPLSKQNLHVLPSTSSPLIVHHPDVIQLTPSTVSQIAAQPTPATVMSLSSLRMEGTVSLPPANESASAEVSGTLVPSNSKSGSGNGTGTSPGNSPGASSGASPGNSSGNSAGQGLGHGASQGQGAGQGPEHGAGQGSANPTAAGNGAGREGQPGGADTGQTQGSGSGTGQGTATQITVPKGGRFGAVVVGASLQDEYPEITGVWHGRMAYTVYLHVGLAHSWILQYSLPIDASVNLNGRVDKLEAPWPYSIVRPNLTPGEIDADAMMVHGFVNTSGRFEALSVISPQPCPQAQFVLHSLQQWQFRPATQNGQIARVEVLLIVPDELD